MSFTFIQIAHLRNLLQTKVTPGAKFNLIYGANGSGKTSFFEALHYLSLGRSFRTRHHQRVIHHEAGQFSLFANIENENNQVTIGVERNKDGKCRLRLNKENIPSMIEITKMLPLQLLNPESRHLLTGFSKKRRAFIDWGVFHVEPSFLSSWQKAQRALKQRNAALKLRSPRQMVELWNMELIDEAQTINNYRQTYLEALTPILSEMLQLFFNNEFQLSFKYKAGWDEDEGLAETLKRSLDRDYRLGYTHHGPHKADLLVRVNKTTPAQDILSQGQQKLLVYALHLAQGILLKKQSGKKCIFLLDDLPAELDIENRKKVAQALHKIDAQVFISGVDRESVSIIEDISKPSMFHVEHGHITSIL
jgi:DNA replication and repair protein RecF